MPSSTDLATLTYGNFEPYLGEVFSLQSAAGELSLRLAGIRNLGPANRTGGAFSLEFVLPVGPVLPQATYALDHAALGSLEIFLVPIGRTPDGVIYEAVFT